jgi:hypothetical protein
MKEDRIYIVGSLDNSVRLIRASTRGQALAHAASTSFTVRLASQNDLVERLSAGIKVESARPPEQLQIDIGE